MNRKAIWAILILIVAGIVAYGLVNRGGPADNTRQTQNTNSNNPSNSSNASPNPSPTSDNGLVGKLLVSDNKAKGNLMLVTATQTLYIRTSRDFGALVGKQVSVTIEGDVSRFKLLDITTE